MDRPMLNRCFLACAWLMLAGPYAGAGEAEPDGAPPEPKIDQAELVESVRGTLLKAVDFLRKRAADDEEGWVVPPIRTRKVVDYKDITVRYRKKTFREPIYEYETYETYERAVGDDSISSKKLKKVKKRRIKKQIGTRKVERLVHDPKGPIQRTVKRAIWGAGGPDFWGVAKLGHNGLALVALRRAGVSADDKAVSRLAENLATFVERYGAPDATWDLACVTAAFATLPDKYSQRLARSLASKLLDGQIAQGKAKGLWGPVCINTKVLAAALRYELVLGKIREKAKATLDKRPSAVAQKKFDQAEAALQKLQEDLAKRIALSASALEKIDYRIYVTPGDEDPITMSGLAHYVFTQTTADTESTAMALWALRIAAEQGVLPKQTERPTMAGRPLTSPQKTGTVLARAARALAAAQRPNGGWTEMNAHQPVKDFGYMEGLPGIPVKPARWPALASRTTGMSTWQGYAGLLGAGHALGLDRLLAKLGGNARRGSARARKLADQLLDGTLKDDALGARVAPFDCCLFLAGVNREFLAAKEDRRDLWLRLAFKLMNAQNNDGSWGKAHPLTYFLSTSLRARVDCKELHRTPDAPPRSRAHTLLGRTEKGEPGWKYLCYGRRSPLRRAPRVHRAGHHLFNRIVHATACSILFLADGVRRPVAGECVWSDRAGVSGLLPGAVGLMRKKCGVALSYAPVQRELPAGELVGLPVLVVRGSGAFALPAEAKTSLGDYVRQGGLIIVAAATDTAGGTFLKEAEAALKGLVRDGAVRDIGGDQDLLAEMAGKVTLNALTTANGAPAAVFLPVTPGERSTKSALTAPQAAAVVSELLLRRVPADVIKESYPTALAGPDDGKEDAKPPAAEENQGDGK